MFLLNKSFDRNDQVNADDMDDLAEVVLDEFSKAKSAKKPMKVKVLPLDKTVDLALLTAAYLTEGMACISSKGRMQKERKKRPSAREKRNRAPYEAVNRMVSEEPEEAAEARAPTQEVPP